MPLIQWHPIETAPKGGGAERTDDPLWDEPPKILLCFGCDGMCVAYWDWYYAEGGAGCTTGYAWIDAISGESLDNHFCVEPTHWAELPFPD